MTNEQRMHKMYDALDALDDLRTEQWENPKTQKDINKLIKNARLILTELKLCYYAEIEQNASNKN